ncbi:hypothetical protein [Mycetocola miduiensis]|uniref:Uncharacterized protein n=1 Tax=Mycetocola miduiensis TaxID=995034 RepID=A0A1I4Z110_9MICO|nr:hypothetical protein [Mycetocola miduiensis]SFN43951.1 hypothetical protein SAMN05216219_0658 [Mycetocola miduiensis]
MDGTDINSSDATVYDTTHGDGIYLQFSGPNAHIEFASQQDALGVAHAPQARERVPGFSSRTE